MSIHTVLHSFNALRVKISVSLALALMLVISAPTANVYADGAEANFEEGSLEEALFGGKVDFNLRLRVEVADADGSDTSQAYTERIRLGYGSKPYNGWSFYLDFEDIRAADDDRYNAIAMDGHADNRTVVADPEDTELNQGYIMYDWKDAATQIKFGRQRITLDDHRFVGNVGWRQNEQTFDAVTFTLTPSEAITFLYSFIWDVNRIFGPDANADFESESHLVNLTINGLPIGKVTIFGYSLDFDNSVANSSDTVGVRLNGKADVDDGLSLVYVLSYAHQVDAGDNTTDFDTDYVLVEGKLVCKESGGHVGVGYEVLGSDGGMAGFRTPLATGHKFNGWADVFLTTPANGLQDHYIFAGAKLPCDISAKVIYHWFFNQEGGGDFGEELDVVFKKPLSDRATATAKLASFDGDGLADVYKVWFQVDYKF